MTSILESCQIRNSSKVLAIASHCKQDFVVCTIHLAPRILHLALTLPHFALLNRIYEGSFDYEKGDQIAVSPEVGQVEVEPADFGPDDEVPVHVLSW